MAHLGTQADVARALKLTPRRVQQLEAEFILPPRRPDGRYDVDLCEQWYDHYKHGTDADHERLLHQLESDARRVDRLVNEGPGSARTLPELKAASRLLQDHFAMLRFSLVTHSREDNFPRQCMLEKFQRFEDEGTGRLISRTLQILCDQAGIPFEEGLEHLKKDGKFPQPKADQAEASAGQRLNRKARRAQKSAHP